MATAFWTWAGQNMQELKTLINYLNGRNQRKRKLLIFLSPHIRESGFWNPGKFCSWNPESWALESGTQLKESGIPLDPKSKFHSLIPLHGAIFAATWTRTISCRTNGFKKGNSRTISGLQENTFVFLTE